MASNERAGFWGRVAGRYDFIMKKDAAAYEAMFRLMEEDLRADMDALELATGTGLVALRIAPCVRSLEATDFSPEMIAEANKKAVPANTRFCVQDATALTYADASFDAVVISNALHIMPGPERALAEIRRVLRPGGILIAPTFVHSEGMKAKVLSRVMGFFGFRAYHRWTQEAFCAFLEQNGFRVRRRQAIAGMFPLVYAAGRVEETA